MSKALHAANGQPLSDYDGLLDWSALTDWLDSRESLGTGTVTGVTQLTGGSQNNIFLIDRGDRRFVLRRPPKHPRPNSNKTMLREARVLSALAGSDVPHPRFIDVCDDPSVLGVNFFLMEPLEGFSPAGDLEGRYASDPNWRYCMGEGFVQAAAALARVDYQSVGLKTFGKPDNWHERQVERWSSQLDGYRSMPGYCDVSLPYVDEVGRWLMDNLPADRRIGIIHGDFQWPNVMFSLDAPRVAGLIDWELSTLGDPMLDMAWVLTSWREEGDPVTKSGGSQPVVQPWDGFMSRNELVNLYGELTGRDMSSMPWFFVLACYKLACLLEGTYARSLEGKASKKMGAFLHDYANWLMLKARKLIAES